MEDVGNPGGRVVVVVVVVVVVEVVVGVLVVVGAIVDVLVISVAPDAPEHDVMNRPNPAIMKGENANQRIFCIFRPKLLCFTSDTLEE